MVSTLSEERYGENPRHGKRAPRVQSKRNGTKHNSTSTCGQRLDTTEVELKQFTDREEAAMRIKETSLDTREAQLRITLPIHRVVIALRSSLLFEHLEQNLQEGIHVTTWDRPTVHTAWRVLKYINEDDYPGRAAVELSLFGLESKPSLYSFTYLAPEP